jgi:plasmid stability protein
LVNERHVGSPFPDGLSHLEKSVFKNKPEREGERERAFNDCFAYNDSMQLDETPMATLTIRKLDADLKERLRLRVRAAQHGHSMEAEARDILRENLKEPERPTKRNLYERIRALCTARRRR